VLQQDLQVVKHEPM
jgi:hypothetical protein